LGAIRALRGELEEHGITTQTELTPDLPLVIGHKGQLQEVLINLIHNAVEAMDGVGDAGRLLQGEIAGRPGIGVSEAGQEIDIRGPGSDAVHGGECVVRVLGLKRR